MSAHSTKARAYKDTTVQQLRSFSETARLGSFRAAADSLGLANPTVWQQVRALERDFGVRLLEPHGRGCRLTEAGLVLAELSGPLVLGVTTLKRRFREALQQLAPRLIVAVTPRILAEDLPDCVTEFQRRYPAVRLTLRELTDTVILAAIKAGEADVGLLHDQGPEFKQLNPWLEIEPVYEVDIALITPTGHPLARRRTVQPGDLRDYPLVNGLQATRSISVSEVLDKAGVFVTQPHLIDATFTTTVRRYVEKGFGIGLIFLPRDARVHPGLHTRVMRRYFGRTAIYQLRRKGAPPFQSVAAFMDVVKERLEHPPARRRRGPAADRPLLEPAGASR
jgi:DNA-binding transcriptional LysR family regulator